MTHELFDVVEVEIAPPHSRRLMRAGLTKKNADAVVSMAIARRGVETHFYVVEPAQLNEARDAALRERG